jgi:hypothetical protein
MTHESSEVQRSNQITFHVCCGLAGGTGSGSVVDAISQIRSCFTPPDHRIILYAQLPERTPEGNKARQNYHANGFAALMELNALSVGAWQPHDVTGVHQGRLTLQDPFNCCYLFGDENEANVSVDVANELPDIVAAFLYQKIVEIRNIHWDKRNTLLTQEGYENQEPMPECSANKPRRARTFFSFGIKQIAYPEAEITEYLTYTLAHQAALQLLYNKWVEGQGYREESTNQPFEEHVREKSTQERWYLTEERLALSEGILKAEINNRKWRTIPDFWKTMVPSYLSMVLDGATSDPLRLLPEFTKLCDEVYREQYRGEGVSRFYETKRKGDLQSQAKEIRGRIEADLFEEWKNGAKSMHDISRLVTALLGMMEERINGMDDKISKTGEESERYRQNETELAAIRQEWAKMGKLSILVFSKHKRLLSAVAERFITRYTMRTRVEGLRYSKELLLALRQELNGLAGETGKAMALIDKAGNAFHSAVNARCHERTADLSRQIVRFYDPAVVRSFAREMSGDMAEQRKQTSRVRTRLAERLGDKQTFAALNTRITEGIFMDLLESTCKESAIEAHREFAVRFSERPRVLQVGLLELLRREYEGNDERLRSYIQSVVEMSKDYLRLDAEQKSMQVTGVASANDSANGLCTSALTVIVPELEDGQQFREKLCKTIHDAATGSSIQVVTNATRSQELTLIHITNMFPIRFVKLAIFLQKAYLKRLHEGGRQAYMELHCEGYGGKLTDGQELPDLYAESYQPDDLRPWVMIAEAMGLLQVAPDPKTGLDRVYLCTKDDAGESWHDMGATIESLIEAAAPSTFTLLQGTLEPLLKNDYLHISKRRELLEVLRTKLQEAAKLHKPNDPAYLSFREGFLRARGILNLEEQNVYA